MTTVFRPTTSEDEPAVINLLKRAFPDDPETAAFTPRLIRWKYWQPREDWPEPRSYVLERYGRIAAHAGLWPVTIPGSGECDRGIHMIDWASDPQSPGAGVSILQRLTRSFPFIYSIGGSAMTLEILPKVGFQRVAEAMTWARPIRPWRHSVQHQYKDLRSIARLGRNLWWSKSPSRAGQSGWEAVQAAPHEVLAGSLVDWERDEHFFRYLEQCPDLRCLTFRMLKEGRQEGYFALSVVQKQARIVGVWLNYPSVSNWRIAFELAQDAALRDTDACEITARGSKTMSGVAAEAAGMRVRNSDAVLFYRKGANKTIPPLEFQIADNDTAFLNDGAVRFAC